MQMGRRGKSGPSPQSISAACCQVPEFLRLHKEALQRRHMILGSCFQQEEKPLLSDCIFVLLPFSSFPCEICSVNLFIAEIILSNFLDSELAASASS